MYIDKLSFYERNELRDDIHGQGVVHHLFGICDFLGHLFVHLKDDIVHVLHRRGCAHEVSCDLLDYIKHWDVYQVFNDIVVFLDVVV